MKPFHILLIEDDEVEAAYMLRSLQSAGSALTVTLARNGLEALAFLRHHHPTRQPCLVLTDLNMPCMNGIEFLQEVRRDPDLRRLVVYVLSSSDLDTDKKAAYAQQAAGYLLKAELERKMPYLIQLLDCYRSLIEFPPQCA